MSSTQENTPAPAAITFKKIPATITLILINVIVFIITYMRAGADNAGLTLTLLEMGAQFNPLTLGKEWYRIFTHMFLHGGLMHLGFNMYALYAVGSEIEYMVGTKKFTVVYFVSGIASALNSLYWSLFTIGVGASGAIFGLFGFSLIINIFLSRRHGKSMKPLLTNFAVFIGINLLIAKSINADNAAHFGGLTAGLLIGLYSLMTGAGSSFRKVKVEYLMILLLVIIYFALPRYQVSYYKFFQQVVAAEDSAEYRLNQKLPDARYLNSFEKNIQDWDSALVTLNQQKYVPPELAEDTARLGNYIRLQKRTNHFRKRNAERTDSVFTDSIPEIPKLQSAELGLDYPLKFTTPARTNHKDGGQ